MKKATAFAIIRAWQADAKLKRLCDVTLADIYARVGCVPFNMMARTFLATFNKEASDLCFSGKFQSAAICLMKTGLAKQASEYLKELQVARNTTYYYQSRKEKDAAACKQLYDSHKRSEQWGVCK